MARTEIWFKQDLKRPVKVQTINGNVFSLDNLGTLVGVKVFEDGQPATLSGSVTGYCILADGETVPVVGVRDGNLAYILMPQSALAVLGTIRISIKIVDGEQITTLAAIVSTVYQTKTDEIVTPSSQVIDDWSAAINAEIQDCADAKAALAEIIAPAFDISTDNPAGSYVTYEGGLYYLPDGHTEGDTWSETSKSDSGSVMMGSDSSEVEESITGGLSVAGRYIDYTDGSSNSSTSTSITGRLTIPDDAVEITIKGFSDVPNGGYIFSEAGGGPMIGSGGSLYSQNSSPVTVEIPVPFGAKQLTYTWSSNLDHGVTCTRLIRVYSFPAVKSDFLNLQTQINATRTEIYSLQEQIQDIGTGIGVATLISGDDYSIKI